MINQTDETELLRLKKKPKSTLNAISRLQLKRFCRNLLPADPSEGITKHYRTYEDYNKFVAITMTRQKGKHI